MTQTLLFDVLYYLSPALVLAVVIRYFSRRVLVAWFLQLPGTVTHEILHSVVGFFSFAGPISVSIIPHRYEKGRWALGGATFRNICWYNAALVSLAPILCLPLCFWLAMWRMDAQNSLSFMDAAYWYAAANLLIAAKPSSQDFLLATRSWPLIPLVLAGWWYWAV